jgi:hypothetical protein
MAPVSLSDEHAGNLYVLWVLGLGGAEERLERYEGRLDRLKGRPLRRGIQSSRTLIRVVEEKWPCNALAS